MTGSVKGRGYDNTARRAASEETRRRVLDAARQAFVARGYRATTLAEVARAAGVHVDTVYALVGRKPVLLRELIEEAISGVDRAVPADERGYVREIRAERDPRAKLARYAAAVRAVHARLAPLFLALAEAAGGDAEARRVWEDIARRRAANMRLLVQDLARAGGLRAEVSVDDAADTIWATASAELYVVLTGERGWTPERYEAWLLELWTRYLVPDR